MILVKVVVAEVINVKPQYVEILKRTYQRGWDFIPLAGKRPIGTQWTRNGRVSLEKILGHKGNVGLRTGSWSGVVVIDFDDGSDPEDFDLPDTVTVRTGGGGFHYYYAYDPQRPVRSSTSTLAAHVDVRGDGGQVVFPGSVHPETGQEYEWFRSPDDVPLAPLPEWVYEKLKAPKPEKAPTPLRPTAPERRGGYGQQALVNECQAVRDAAEGSRNDTLNTAAFNLGQLVKGGYLERGVIELELFNAASDAGLTDLEIKQTIKSGLEKGIANPRDMGKVRAAKSSGKGSPAETDGGTRKRKTHATPEAAAKAMATSLRRKYSKDYHYVEHWSYDDEDGEEIGRVCRFEVAAEGPPSAETRPIHVVPGGWQAGEPKGGFSLYRLPSLMGATSPCS